MSENEIVCTECGRVRPTQVTVCPKHDFRHEIDKHCDHCENEVAAQLTDAIAFAKAADVKAAAELADKVRKATQDLINAGANSGT